MLASTKTDVPRVFLRAPQSSPLLKNNSRLVLDQERGRRRTIFPLFFSRDKCKTIQKTIEKRKKGKKEQKRVKTHHQEIQRCKVSLSVAAVKENKNSSTGFKSGYTHLVLNNDQK